jgi:iron(III) transport system permease protein
VGTKHSFGFAKTWKILSYLIAGMAVFPVLTIFFAWLLPEKEIWNHIAKYLLADILTNTLLLLIGVLVGTTILALPLAWLVAMTNLPGKSFFKWALLMPLAFPSYVLAFIYVGFFESLPLAISSYLPSIRSYGGVVFVLSLSFYPYLYLIAYGAFLTQGSRLFDVARGFGMGPWQLFLYVGLTRARPWIIAALTLIGMETLADFGAVSVFNYNTFTTAIYKAWYGFFSPEAAAQLSSVLVILIAVFLVIRSFSLKHNRYVTDQTMTQKDRIILTKKSRIGAFSLCAGALLLGFIFPAIQLAIWAIQAYVRGQTMVSPSTVYHSLKISLIVSIVCITCSIVLSVTKRAFSGRSFAGAMASLGYALPGSILAIGVYLPFAWFDGQLILLAERFDLEIGRVLTGGIGALILGLTIRFIALSQSSLDAGYQRISSRLDEVATNLGTTGKRLLFKIHFPLLRPAMVGAMILVAVDVLKEMPLTLMVRPFGVDTLSVKIFEYTNEGEWQKAAVPALILLLIGFIPIFFIMKRTQVSHE